MITRMRIATAVIGLLFCLDYGMPMESILYPHGIETQDQTYCEIQDSRYDIRFHLTTNFWFYGKEVDSMKIPLDDLSVLLVSSGANYAAPEILAYSYSYSYWLTQNIKQCENLMFGESTDSDLLDKGMNDVQHVFSECHNNFKPERLFLLTWRDVMSSPYEYWLDCMSNVGNHGFCDCKDLGYPTDYCDCLYFEKKDWYYCFWYRRSLYIPPQDEEQEWVYEGYEGNNTVQLVLMYAGQDTFLMLNFAKLEWYKTFQDDIPMFALYPGRPKYPYQSHWDHWYIHPYSKTKDILKLATESNVGIPGRWMYKVSEKGRFIGPDCRKMHI